MNKKQKISKIFSSLFTVAIISAVLLIVISFLPIPGNYKLFIVESGSMEPAIKTGSVVIVKPVENYQAGDVITFKDRGKDMTTTHRIVDIEAVSGQKQYITKGDANNAEDSRKVFEDKVVGKVLTSVPFAGYILAFAKTKLGFVLLVIVPSAIIVLEEMGKIYKEVKLSKKKKEGQEMPQEKGNEGSLENNENEKTDEIKK